MGLSRLSCWFRTLQEVLVMTLRLLDKDHAATIADGDSAEADRLKVSTSSGSTSTSKPSSDRAEARWRVASRRDLLVEEIGEEQEEERVTKPEKRYAPYVSLDAVCWLTEQ